MLKRREVLLININGITPEPEIQARYTVHKKRCVPATWYYPWAWNSGQVHGTQKKGVYLLPGITPEPEIQARYTVHKKKGVYLAWIKG